MQTPTIPAKAAAVAVLALTAAGSLGTATGGIAQGATATRTVHVVDIDFSPRRLVVSRGTTVRWSFEDEATPHNVTSRGAKHFRSSPTQQNGTYSVRFTKPGTYTYVCTIHLNMKGRVVVR